MDVGTGKLNWRSYGLSQYNAFAGCNNERCNQQCDRCTVLKHAIWHPGSVPKPILICSVSYSQLCICMFPVWVSSHIVTQLPTLWRLHPSKLIILDVGRSSDALQPKTFTRTKTVKIFHTVSNKIGSWQPKTINTAQHFSRPICMISKSLG